MDIKVSESKAGDVYIQLVKNSSNYKLFRSFIKQGITTTQDASLRMTLSALDKLLETPESGDMRNNVPTIHGSDGGVVQNTINNLNTKMDMLFKTIGALQNTKSAAVQVELNQNTLEGFIHRIEDVVHSILNSKMDAIIGDQNNKTHEIEKGINSLKAIIKDALATKAPVSVPAKTPEAPAPVKVPVPVAKAPETPTPVKASVSVLEKTPEISTKASVSTPATKVSLPVSTEASIVKDLPLDNTNEPKAVACNDRIRYPSVNKKVQSACFGNFLEGKTLTETPCLSCVWVNDCKTNKTQQKPANKHPECFGKNRHDLDCGVCSSNVECLNVSD